MKQFSQKREDQNDGELFDELHRTRFLSAGSSGGGIGCSFLPINSGFVPVYHSFFSIATENSRASTKTGGNHIEDRRRL
jgi:hypothetical protein